MEEQEITPEALDALTEADIELLIPKLGPRALFRKRLQAWLQTPRSFDISIPTQSAKPKTQANNDELAFTYVDDDDDGENEMEVLSEVWINDNDDEIGDDINDETTPEAQVMESHEIEIENTNDDLINSDVVEIARNVFTEEQKPNVNKLPTTTAKYSKAIERPKRAKRIEDYKNLTKNQIFHNNSISMKVAGIKVENSAENTNHKRSPEELENEITQDKEEIVFERLSPTVDGKRRCQRIGNNYASLNVEELLLSSHSGRLLIENYEMNPMLDKRARFFLADTIVRETFAKNLIMDRYKFENIAEQIVTLFPTEDKKSWYVAQKTAKKGSGGTLYYKYYATYTKMRKNGFYQHYVESVANNFDSDASLSAEIENGNYAIKLEDIGDDPFKDAFKRSIPKYERIRNSSDFERIDVKAVLEKSYEGLGIIDFYETNSALDVTTRNRLCKLVCMDGINRNIKLQPCNFYDISCQIVELFPNEKHEVYFFPRGKTPPKGCLYHKYIYLMRRMKKMKLLRKNEDNADV